MKIIYSYKILNNFWKKRTKDFFNVARLSVEYSRKLYTTVLYTDSLSKQIFDSNKVFFDEYVINDSLFTEVNEHTYGLSKFAVFRNETSPYITLDLDAVLFENITSNNSITYGYKEVDLTIGSDIEEKQIHIDYLKRYYSPYFNKVENRFEQNKFTLYTDIYPSNSLVLVNNPFLMKECADAVIKFMNKDYRSYTVQFYEQYLLYMFLRNYKADIGFISESNPIIDLNKEYVMSDIFRLKFLHLDKYDRDPKIISLANKLFSYI